MINNIITFVKKGNILVGITTGGSGIVTRNQHNHTLFRTGRAIWLVVRAADNPIARPHHFLQRCEHANTGPYLERPRLSSTRSSSVKT